MALAVKDLIGTKKTLVCVGPGGVGKTTTAAAMGVIGARAGLRTLVCTIDPAPRLADALGIASLSGEPTAIHADAAALLGIALPGTLHATRVEPEAAFAQLVNEQVADPELRKRIFANSLYRHVTTTLTGSQEYAATLALYHLSRSGKFDLIVLDTPPTTNALEFLETPERLAAAISSPALQWFARPDPSTSRFSLKRLGSGGALMIRRAGRLVGSQFLDDLGGFLLDIRDVLGGFLTRAREIEALLRQPDVAFMLVLSPETAAVNEALDFTGKLRERGMPLSMYIANRTVMEPMRWSVEELRAQLKALPLLHDMADDERETALRSLGSLHAYLTNIAQAQKRELERLARESPGLDIVTVPLLPHDVSNLESLQAIANRLENA
jgi:anion-transporting  ArsA/GET3 family ATPase